MGDAPSSEGQGAPRRTPAPTAGRTRSMVPGRTGTSTARATTPQPGGRMQFRPVMPQRRRAPSTGVPAEAAPTAAPAPEASAPRARRAPMEMTASGPFALGPNAKTASSSSIRTAATRPAMSGAGPTTSNAPADDDDVEATGVDIHDMHELDAAAPQPLLKAPPQFKRETPQIKSEGNELEMAVDSALATDTPDVNRAQALDLSESEDEEGEDELAGRFVASLQDGQSEGQTFLFQFPRPFPTFTASPPAKEDSEVVDVDAPAKPAPPPAEGQVGELQIFESGRVLLHLGGIPFDITGGSETSFLQQVMLLDADQQRALCLGELDAKLLATPDLAYLLDQTHVDP